MAFASLTRASFSAINARLLSRIASKASPAKMAAAAVARTPRIRHFRRSARRSRSSFHGRATLASTVVSQAHKPLIAARVQHSGRGTQEAEVAGAGEQGVKRCLSIPQVSQVALVDQTGGQRAVHLAERQMGQQHLEPLGIGSGVAQCGERGTSRLNELARGTAFSDDLVEVLHLRVESHLG